MKKLVLASKSPRRNEILKKAGFNFSIITSDYEEELETREFSYEKIEALAKNKAQGAIPHTTSKSLIISADTVVVLNNTILTKPTDRNDAYNILKSLSDKEHFVVTSLCIMDSESKKYVLKSTTTKVKFHKLTDEQIYYYIDTFKPYDKAGAYGIQEMPEGYVKSVNGDLENVVGLSSKAVKETIEKFSLL